MKLEGFPVLKYPKAEESESELYVSTMKSLKVLMESDLKGPTVIIEDLLSVGVNLLFALQNKGKTWMALQIARCVTCGEALLGKQVKKTGKVLFFCLEDGEANLKQRADLQWKKKGNPEAVLYSDMLETPNKGGWRSLEAEIKLHKPILVIIDNLMTFFGNKSIDTNKFSEMSEYIGKFRKLATEYEVCFLLVHHGKKPSVGLSGSGPEAAIGSTAISANCATRLQIHSPDKGAVLETWSKVFPNQRLTMKFSDEDFLWERTKQ